MLGKIVYKHMSFHIIEGKTCCKCHRDTNLLSNEMAAFDFRLSFNRYWEKKLRWILASYRKYFTALMHVSWTYLSKCVVMWENNMSSYNFTSERTKHVIRNKYQLWFVGSAKCPYFCDELFVIACGDPRINRTLVKHFGVWWFLHSPYEANVGRCPAVSAMSLKSMLL